MFNIQHCAQRVIQHQLCRQFNIQHSTLPKASINVQLTVINVQRIQNSILLMQLTLCKIVSTLYWWITKDLASRMQMTVVKTITREQLRQSIVYKNGNYSIDFRQLNVIDDNSFRDINVKMEVG